MANKTAANPDAQRMIVRVNIELVAIEDVPRIVKAVRDAFEGEIGVTIEYSLMSPLPIRGAMG